MRVLALLFAVLPAAVSAAPFTITGAGTTAQTLGPGQGGTVAAQSSLTVAGSAAAVTMTGDRATFSNFGTLAQAGAGHAIVAPGGAGLAITNGSSTNATALIQAANGQVIKLEKGVSNVTFHHYGMVVSLHARPESKGGQALDFTALESTSTIHNHAGGVIRAVDADAVRPGKEGVVINAGTIVSARKSAKGDAAIDGRKNAGIRVTNTRGGVIEGGGSAITGEQDGNAAYTMHVTNEVGAVIRGMNGAGLNFDGRGAGQMVTVDNQGTIVGTGMNRDGDGIDVDGMVTITNSGIIRSVNAVADKGKALSEAISAGGGTIVNAGTIEGLVADGNTNAVGRAISLVGNDPDENEAGEREGIHGNARVVNQPGGVIRGGNDSAIVAAGQANDFAITIDNQAGATIVGGSQDEAAVRSDANRTVITNAGTIDGATSNKAIALGHANNTLVVQGGSAVIKGAIDGGAGGGTTMVVDAGAGKEFTYAGAITRFDTLEVKSGHARLSGQTGFTSKIVVSGGLLTLSGPQPVPPGAALVLAGSAGQAFASLSLLGDAAIDAGTRVLSVARIGQVVPGKTLALNGGLRVAGNAGRDAAFQALMRATRIGASPVTFNFDGRDTVVAPARKPERGRLAGAGGARTR